MTARCVKQAESRPFKTGLPQKTGGIRDRAAAAIAQAAARRYRAEQRKVGTVNTRPARSHFSPFFSKRTVSALKE